LNLARPKPQRPLYLEEFLEKEKKILQKKLRFWKRAHFNYEEIN
jgi:hypothetical protein